VSAARATPSVLRAALAVRTDSIAARPIAASASSRHWDWGGTWYTSATVSAARATPSVLGAALAVGTDTIAARATAAGSYTSTTAAMSAARSAPSVLSDEKQQD
jgi:hypothetical protein